MCKSTKITNIYLFASYLNQQKCLTSIFLFHVKINKKINIYLSVSCENQQKCLTSVCLFIFTICLFYVEGNKTTVKMLKAASRQKYFKKMVTQKVTKETQVRQISEKVQEQPEYCSDRDKRTEFR